MREIKFKSKRLDNLEWVEDKTKAEELIYDINDETREISRRTSN